MTIYEKTVIKLISFLIKFVGRNVDGFYGHCFDECLEEIYKKSSETENNS